MTDKVQVEIKGDVATITLNKPERLNALDNEMWHGIGEACRALDFPVVSGNVSLYNETNGRAILPTPSIGGVGLIEDFAKSATLALKRAGETIILVGETTGWLGQSMYLRELCGQEEGRLRRSILPRSARMATSCVR